ncbi:MAG TPA: low affinity iron permease family protein [Dehalococcoidia bacterium]|nr:low affinity iron permease family protein [Dehalococcoidia bacterium]
MPASATRSRRGPSPFTRFARGAARFTGLPPAFATAVVIVLAWAVTGPLFGFSDTWQLVINTGTTIVTFLMVFLIQSTQNTDSMAVQLKLDELIRAVSSAKNSRLSMENLDQQELDRIREEYEALGDNARKGSKSGRAAPARSRRRGSASSGNRGRS